MWPASALLTGNGVAFILRVPGTEHGDWWSMDGAWIFAAASAVGLLSKYLITFRGRHVFNPSNFGLVPIFLLLGPERADPLAFWWGPLSPALVLALAIIVAGGFAILGRLHLTHIAVGFWLTFAAGIGVLAASGHTMTAAWHVGPIEGADFWWTLVTSPEILVFLFFMITDPRTIPASPAGRRAYAVGVGLLATLLIAPFTTEFATKVAVLGALFLVCAARAGAARLDARRRQPPPRSRPRRESARAALALVGAVSFVGLVVAAGIPARPEAAASAPGRRRRFPTVTVADSAGVARIDRRPPGASRATSSPISDEAEALRRRPGPRGGRRPGSGSRALAADRRRTPARSPRTTSRGCGSPSCRATTRGRRPSSPASRGPRRPGERWSSRSRTGRYRIVRSEGGVPCATRPGRAEIAGLAGRHVADERRAGGRPDLPARRIPLRHVERPDLDDGRRSLLARLRRGRLARPLRRQLLRGHRVRRLARRRAVCPGQRSSGTSREPSRT